MPLTAELFTVNLYVALAAPLVGSAVAAAAKSIDGITSFTVLILFFEVA